MDVQLSKIAREFLKEMDAFYIGYKDIWVYIENGVYKELKQENNKLVNINSGEVIG